MKIFLFFLLIGASIGQTCDDLQKLIKANDQYGKSGVFTRENYPDAFKELTSLHIPTVTIDANKGKATLQKHPMTADHHITDIWVYDDQGRNVTCVKLNSSDTAELSFPIPSDVKSLIVYEHCNLHGVWATETIDTTCDNLHALIEENEKKFGKAGAFTVDSYPESLKDLVALHIPLVMESTDKKNGHVSLKHPMTKEHLIDDIWILDQNERQIGCIKLNATDHAFDAFTIPEGVTSITAYAHCNLHGVWAASPKKLSRRNNSTKFISILFR